ncbi:MAG: DUF1146 domain-containing protein [Erysipelotrichaceae bacterium]|nr:DUF1146 domain-containing protein [Erysipelotrichaceae bacterium]
MIYHFVKIGVYILSIGLAMISLSCFRFDEFIHKGKVREFYLFYIMASIVLGYLFASFIIDFGNLSFSYL